MVEHYRDDWLTIHGGDCRAVLREMPAASVDCVVTSPPYWGLRDYGTAAWDGGDADCDHLAGPLASDKSGLQGGNVKDTDKIRTNGMPFRGDCGRCGATRIDSQLGLEPTPEEYVVAMVDVFREVRRVLRDDGTLWLNLGDSYASDMKGSGGPTEKQSTNVGSFYEPRRMQHGLKPKDLVGIPWRVAFALQADGWYLRSDIIWAKPNPMPESVTDRPTKSHEYLFLLAKSARYFFDADAVREEAEYGRRASTASWHEKADSNSAGVRLRETTSGSDPSAGRNIRSVWTIATAPYPGAHFATFPPKLVEPCIKAGCPPDGVVLDPFAGTGTVGMVAQQLSRRAVLVDLNPDYLRQCLARNAQTPLGLADAMPTVLPEYVAHVREPW